MLAKSFGSFRGSFKPCGVWALRLRYALGTGDVRRRTPDIDRRRIDHVFEVGGVEFLDHLNRSAQFLAIWEMSAPSIRRKQM